MRNKAVIVRLREWSAWVISSMRPGGPARMRSWWGPMVTDPNMGSDDGWERRLHEPINEERADLTDKAVKQLELRPRKCIWQQYVRGGTKEQKAAAYGCKESTFYEHLEAAELLLEEILLEQEKFLKTPLRRRTGT